MIVVFFKVERIVEWCDGGDGIEVIMFSWCCKLLVFGGVDVIDVGDEFNFIFCFFGDDF